MMVLTLLFAVAMWPKEPIKVFGVSLGSSKAEIVALVPGVECRATAPNVSTCTDYAPTPPFESVTYVLAGKRLVYVNAVFPMAEFGHFAAEYGAPSQTHVGRIQISGASYSNVTMVWRGTSITLMVDSRGNDAEHGTAAFLQTEFLNEALRVKALLQRSPQ